MAALPPLRDVIRRYGLAAEKTLGQNFLLDLNLTRRIARAAGALEGNDVIEIGPGPGGLTRALLETPARRVIAVERDPRFLPALEELTAAYPGRLAVHQADALAVDLGDLGEAPRQVIANLPYNVASPLLVRMLERIGAFGGLTLMFQKEVAMRLVAAPHSRDYGRLSVLAQWLCQVTRVFDIPPQAFVPPPKVVSAVVRLIPRVEPLAPARREDLQRVLAAAFGQRRKMLRASLRTLSDATEAWCTEAGVAVTARAEDLTVEEFCALARSLHRYQRGP